MLADTTLHTHLQNSRAALKRRHYWLAIPLLNTVLQEAPTHVEAHELLGIAHTMAGDPAAAKRAFQAATRLDPGRATGHFNFAVFLFENNDLDDASEELQTTLFLAPSHKGAIELQGRLSERLRFRDTTAEEGFAVVGSAGRNLAPSPTLETLRCEVCGAMNRVMARVCKKCNSYIPEMPDIVPVE